MAELPPLRNEFLTFSDVARQPELYFELLAFLPLETLRFAPDGLLAHRLQPAIILLLYTVVALVAAAACVRQSSPPDALELKHGYSYRLSLFGPADIGFLARASLASPIGKHNTWNRSASAAPARIT
ncbi:hypothetical protein Q4S45_19385 [Massilia sp. R2A-15]|uniref:hypothetical protein n=1 Tax=Massilia sp. R2A-15 TaxID=3064278 RepID=UPI002737689E|nr:hypothetical protein [Massilia sp. R2A-15]WLI88846.1 hypothetical protein Q4S45_19385 [Massilia sp. R2A-15]